MDYNTLPLPDTVWSTDQDDKNVSNLQSACLPDFGSGLLTLSTY